MTDWQRSLINVAGYHIGQEPLDENPVDGLVSDFESLLGRSYNIPVSSGTAAIHCVLSAIEVQPGDEILVPANTCAAVVMAVLAADAVPVLVDIDESLTIDPAAVTERVTERTRAIIAVHQFGTVANLQALRRDPAQQIILVEDCAQSIGALVADRPTGTFGDISIFSFAHGKIISAGHGGFVTLDDPLIACKARRFSQLGADIVPFHLEEGLNYEMAPLPAVIIRQQLAQLNENLAARSQLAALYHKFLSPLGFVPVKSLVAESTSAWHRCVMLAPPDVKLSQRLDEALNAAGVPFQLAHPCPLHRAPIMDIVRSIARRHGSVLDPAQPVTRTEALGNRVRYFRVGPQQSFKKVEAALSRLLAEKDWLEIEVAP